MSAYAASSAPEARSGSQRCPLLLRAGELEAERAELLDGEDEAARRTDLRDLLDRDEREERPGSRAAHVLVEEEPEDPLLAEELDDVPRELVRLVDLRRAWRDAVASDRPHKVAELELLGGQRLPGHERSLGWSGRRLADRLDVVAVRIADERPS